MLKNVFRILLFCIPAFVARAESTQTKILGIAQVTFYAHDLAASRSFYHDYLGLPEIPADSSCYYVNDHQALQLIQEKTAGDRLASVTLQIDDRRALMATILDSKIDLYSFTGSKDFYITDPDNHEIRFTQLPSPLPALPRPDLRISARISHAGIIVMNLDASLHLYRDVLHFQETWRGANNPQVLSWVNAKLPDSNDYLEFMLFSKLPAESNRRTPHHVCLEVEDVAKSWDILKTRTAPPNLKPPTAMKTGINGKRQINLYDPDGTRIEIMEPATFNHQPVPPSTLPAPNENLLYTPTTSPAK